MRKVVIFFLFMTLPVLMIGSASHAQGAEDSVYVKRIYISGFLLRDKKPIEKIVKANQKKWLTSAQIQQIVDHLKVRYLEAGYTELVDIQYKMDKKNLRINILLLNR